MCKGTHNGGDVTLWCGHKNRAAQEQMVQPAWLGAARTACVYVWHHGDVVLLLLVCILCVACVCAMSVVVEIVQERHAWVLANSPHRLC